VTSVYVCSFPGGDDGVSHGLFIPLMAIARIGNDTIQELLSEEEISLNVVTISLVALGAMSGIKAIQV
jgi:hypothetical protein